ncbi:MAG: NADP-dependent oxidoreductase [Deltaproteobacteria bacterium]|nr:NADP-dependent oxidoreductase [Deltaproteobacteria bacterium]
MSDVNRQWRLASHPQGMVRTTDFALHEAPVPEPDDGEFLVRVLYLSFDPAMRTWMSGRDTYIPGLRVGQVMRGMGVGQVVASRHAKFPEGAFVLGGFGWQELAKSDGGGKVRPRLLPPGLPPTLPLGVLGTTGLTGYFGMLDVGRPEPGQMVVVSGAAGATGSIAGQVAKLQGCEVVGIAGGPRKCGWLVERAGFDAAIDYKSEDVPARLRALCPDGIDVFFDNVGGPILNAALANLALRARIVVCGGISSYNDVQRGPGPSNYLALILKRARMEGFIILDYADRFEEASLQLAQWVMGGKMHHLEDIQEGFENAPETLLRLFDGRNFGKQMLKLADPPLPG